MPQQQGGGAAYGKEYVNQIHKDQDQVTDTCLVVVVRARDEGNGDEVVGQHLPMVLAAFLNVDNKDLLQPEGPLRQEIAFAQALQLADRPVGPEFLKVKVVVRVRIQVLARRL